MEMKDRIMHIMREAGMSQSDFSKATGIPAASLSSIFTGRTAPTMKHAEAIHRYCPTLNMAWLLFGEGEMHVNGELEGNAESENDFDQEQDSTLDPDFNTTPARGVDPAPFGGEHGGQMDAYSSTARVGQLQNVRVREAGRSVPRGVADMSNMSRFQHTDILPSMYDNGAADARINLNKPSKKIVEIRIFFDDGTFETFQGN